MILVMAEDEVIMSMVAEATTRLRSIKLEWIQPFPVDRATITIAPTTFLVRMAPLDINITTTIIIWEAQDTDNWPSNAHSSSLTVPTVV